jgi:hypothetical protein
MKKFAISDFVRRQTPNSRFSHFEGTDMCLLRRVDYNFRDAVPGYRDGVVIVPISNMEGFFAGICKLKSGDRLAGDFIPRRDGEDPRKNTCVVGGKKEPAKKVDVVLYRKEVLGEQPDHVSLAEWEIVSINCSPVEGDMPINPITLLHNHFGSSGGTATGLSDSDLVAMLRESFDWWKDKAFVEERPEPTLDVVEPPRERCKCGSNAVEWAPCPYDEEIHGDTRICNCCDCCRRCCNDDI